MMASNNFAKLNKSLRNVSAIQNQDDNAYENQYFYEDEIFCVDNRGRVKFGLVLENFEVSEEEGFEEDTLKRGEIRACWHPDGLEEIIEQNKVGLADRTLMPGDVVRKIIPGKDTQRGYCHEIFVRADVKIVGTKYVVKNVSSDRLRPLMSMPKDNAVCLDSWVGSTKNINEKLVLKSQCGSLVEIRPDIEYCTLKDSDTRSRSGYFAGTMFYPGQTLIGPINDLENAKWINTSAEMKLSRKHKMMDRKFTVQSVEIEGIWVHWQCKASCDDVETEMKEGGIQQPPDYVTGENLKKIKKLNLFESCMLQINDKNYLKIQSGDSFCKKSQWRKEVNSKFLKIINKDGIIRGSGLDNVFCDIENHETTGNSTVESISRDKLESNNAKLCLTAHKEISLSSKSRRNMIRCGNGKSTSASATCKLAESDEWQTDLEDEEDDDVDDGEPTVSDGGGSTISSSCSSTTTSKSSPKKSPLLAKKIRKLKKRSSFANTSADKPPSVGDELITETLVVYSTATVVWQDGTIEFDIPSTDLCPIHHLDDHEFFPGDFVLSGNTDISHNPLFRDYGVIQNVDHHGRTAKVKWFSTYTCLNEPQPIYNGESEVSVYDLKDHPDFQYRPGTIVIRVANFIGDDSKCSAGQVIDNYPNGMVKVWWVDGHVSMCWPQDIFEVGQYDSDNNFWGNESDNNSWETEDEISELGGLSPQRVSKPKLAANLERARVAMARLEELFIINPHLQNQEIMKKLLMVYKKCRYLDRLMDTSFFHEDHFMGLVERVRKSNNQTTAERALDQKIRLFNQTGSKTVTPTADSPDTDQRLPSNSNQSLSSSGGTSIGTSSKKCITPFDQSYMSISPSFKFSIGNNISTSSDISSIEENATVMTISKPSITGNGVADSGNFSIKNVKKYCQQNNTVENDNNLLLNAELDKVNDLYMNICEDMNNTNSVFSFPTQTDNVSAKLCSLIKAQLVKALQETSNAQSFYKAVQREHKLLRTALPSGVWVRTFEDRLDLLSVMIEGPKKTPYEGGLFLFDIQLGQDYPSAPPLCHYISYCSDRLNPNLYEDGKVCVSLLGTWSGRGTEMWGPNSTLLQVIVSIQGLILVDEPYFNEAGYDKQKGSQQGKENSRMYNEMVILKLVQSMSKMIANPPEIFSAQIIAHFREHGLAMHNRIKSWMDVSIEANRNVNVNSESSASTLPDSASIVDSVNVSILATSLPDFPLIPASRGFCLTLIGLLKKFQEILNSISSE
ncbi:(E3-independent) E2 ubiquitin-conjugating enzyme UBE2O isoform X2 [Sabethes cyaneus]|uniref:(E3-independent) E2 ubiquitin-conjugating enzyme UBE2O isoform X2 n=1 Tax=Sabethes cyaneus TaxID=53552 RepID=UPI00237E58D0|nr:(E3-independent) E2 ubiquitin-conjugating enzyme UBE2O isoform X2 [Sabethes cyaneus]